jgi:SOS-response transcriptional repressor LexA
MRIYQTATVVEERLTGFQSPCSEFAEKPLSLDEKFGVGNPALIFLRVEASLAQHAIYKGDWVVVDLARKPRARDLLVAYLHDELRVVENKESPELEGARTGVVIAVIRDYR